MRSVLEGIPYGYPGPRIHSAKPAFATPQPADQRAAPEPGESLGEEEPSPAGINFARFVAAQYLFQHDLEPLYRNEALARLPSAGFRARDDAARADLDLGHPVPEGDQSVQADLSLAEALGWLFVSKVRGGRCVPVQESRRARTRRTSAPAIWPSRRRPRARLEELVAILDGIELNEEEERLAAKGASDAFNRFGDLLERTFA